MRKRDRLRIAAQLLKISNDFQEYVLGQIGGAHWYFEQNAEIKGFNSAYAAKGWAIELTKELETVLKAVMLLDDKATAASRKRKRPSGKYVAKKVKPVGRNSPADFKRDFKGHVGLKD